MGKIDEAIATLKKTNANGRNNWRIGMFLSEVGGRTDEALEYLSEGLTLCYNQLFYTCLGYANVYIEKGEYEKLKKILLCFYDFGQDLRDTSKVSYIDRFDIRIFTILASVAIAENDTSTAREHLGHALSLAERFDNEKNYKISSVTFYYGWEDQVAFDDMGDTAIAVIANFINENPFAKALLPIWQELYVETEKKK